MRDGYELTAFLQALEAWQKHETEYLSRLKAARQPDPSAEQLKSYRNVFIEGWIECYAEIETAEGQ